MMRFLLFTLLAVLYVFPCFVAAQETDRTARPISFKIRTVPGFAMQGGFEGEYHVLANSIEVKITKANFLLQDNSPYRGRRMLKSLSFGLATYYKDENHFQSIKTSQSQPLAIEKEFRSLDRHTLGTIYFSIPKDQNTDFSKAWIFASIAVEPLDLFQGQKMQSGFSYAHTCQNVFTPEYLSAPCKSKF